MWGCHHDDLPTFMLETIVYSYLIALDQ